MVDLHDASLFLSLSLTLVLGYLFIYFQQRSERITSHLQLVSRIRQHFAAAPWAAHARAGLLGTPSKSAVH